MIKKKMQSSYFGHYVCPYPVFCSISSKIGQGGGEKNKEKRKKRSCPLSLTNDPFLCLSVLLLRPLDYILWQPHTLDRFLSL